jgi:hypothetical protein
METSARREDFVETDRAQNRLDQLGSNPLPEGARSRKPTQPPDQVWPDLIHEGAGETFVHGAGI